MSDSQTRPRLAASDAAFGWCLRNALRMERLGDFDRAARWALVAAHTAAEFGHSHLCSAPLETLLLRLGRRLPDAARAGGGPMPAGRRRWLHVITRSYAFGGHTALVRRWIARNPFAERHSMALTFQTTAEANPKLVEAVRGTGGAVHSIADVRSLLDRAAELRRLAREEADVVVVHSHWWDVVPSLAFAVPGGPPVLLVNHADHSFWVGGAISDIVVDIRDSGLSLSTSFRGVRGSAVLPIPLDDHGPAPHDRSLAASRLRDPAMLACDLVLLTIGSAHKYRPWAHLDFPASLLRIVEAIPGSVLIAVGPRSEDALWQRLAERTAGRVVAIGPDTDLAPWHAAADLYLEGFPIGSYTALLEVALAERAFVRKPLLMPPSALPIDRGGLAAFKPPADPDAYALTTMALAGDAGRRAAHAREARRAVLAEHCGDGWSAHLEALQRAIPAQHDVGLAFEPPPMPGPLAEYWAGIHATSPRQGPLAYVEQCAREHGLWPRFDVALVDAMRNQ